MKIIPTILSTALLGALTTPVAHASQTPYMWGIGPTVNTIVLPGNHPFEFPDVVKSAGFKTTGGDVGFGLHGVLHMRKNQRFGTHMWYHVGDNGYSSPNMTLDYDFIGTSANNVHILAGLGVGFGSQSWLKDNGAEFRMNTFIARAQASVGFRSKRNCYQIGAFMNLYVPGDQTINRTNGTQTDVPFAIYPTLGLEFTTFFGDFKPPKKRSNRRSRRNRKNK